jgi:hypothetical protein
MKELLDELRQTLKSSRHKQVLASMDEFRSGIATRWCA